MAPKSRNSGMTPEQAQSTHPQVTAWVGASAGTGKTHVLTARVLRLMLTGTEPENIVCLTFTKAAAAEMKNRIFAELGRWTTLSDEDLSDIIATRTDEFASQDMLTRARQLFARVLDLAGGMQIQTFHSFCQALLGRFPLEAGMTPGFEGLDEAEASELMLMAKDRMLARTNEPLAIELTQALERVAGLVTERTFDDVIERLAFDAPLLAKATMALGGVEGLMDALFQRLGANRTESDRNIVAAASAAGAFDAGSLAELGEALALGSKTDQGRGSLIRAYLDAEDKVAFFDAYKGAFLTKSGTPLKTVATKKVLEAQPGLQQTIEDEQERLLAVEEQRRRLRAAKATAALLRLGLEQLKLYRHQKMERGLVDFDDMIDRTVTLFGRADVAPWVLYKLDNRIDHILVDEAQDTNRDQWRVVETLAAEFFSGEGARDIERTIFAVGDVKQSIFSFQRADPREFLNARDRIFARAQEAGRSAQAVPLDLSFRSGEAVLSLVDSVFAAGSRAADGVASDREPVRHQFVRSGHGGHVELWPLETPRRSEEEEAGWKIPLRQEDADDAQKRLAWRMADHIRGAVGVRDLPSKGRKVRPGDVLVLVRRRTAFVDHLVRALKSFDLPVAGRDRMVLTEELPVMDMLAVARSAILPTDDLTLATVLKTPFVGLNDDDVFELAHGRKGSLWDALYAKRRDARYSEVYHLLVDLMGQADIVGPFEFFNYLLIQKNGRRKLVARLGEEIHDPVDELLDEALRYELTHAASLLDFVEQTERTGTQLKRDMEQAGDRVRVMTCHSAKGLQAPIVYLSDLVSLPDLTKDGRLLPIEAENGIGPAIPVWASQARGLSEIENARDALRSRQLAEYRRLLYVALTRAEDELYVAGWRGPQEPSADSWFSLVQDGFERLAGTVPSEGGQAPLYSFSVGHTAEVEAERVGPAAVSAVEEAPNWLFEDMPEEPAPSRPLSPSRPEEEPAAASPLADHGRSRYRRGNLLHALLQWLPDLPDATREQAARRFLEQAPNFASEETEAYVAEVMAILHHPELRPLFGPKSRAEVPVAGLVPTMQEPKGRAISGQVDRLVVEDERVMIIDYKTNRPPPERVEAVPAAYLRQMGLYQRALADIYPGKDIVAALLWTDATRLMQLPQDLIDEALRRANL